MGPELGPIVISVLCLVLVTSYLRRGNTERVGTQGDSLVGLATDTVGFSKWVARSTGANL